MASVKAALAASPFLSVPPSISHHSSPFTHNSLSPPRTASYGTPRAAHSTQHTAHCAPSCLPSPSHIPQHVDSITQHHPAIDMRQRMCGSSAGRRRACTAGWRSISTGPDSMYYRHPHKQTLFCPLPSSQSLLTA
jgi:hypothetical protein